MSAPSPAPNSAPASGMRGLLLVAAAVMVALLVLQWLTRPESLPPVDGLEVTLTDDNFRQEVLDHEGYVLVDFWFEGCPPCRAMAPVVAHLSVNYRDRVKVGKLDIDQHVAVPAAYGLEAFPTLLLFNGGELVARWDGYGDLNEMSQWLDEQLANPPAANATTSDA